jgi:exodeoxyribonuclease V gamma subunit
MPHPHPTGLLILHGNRLEVLAEAVFGWLAANPLKPLEEETFLVQSNGMAEWLKMELAAAHGVCASTRVELPARFIWRAYRAVLGRHAVPRASALDKLPLTWRLMQLLPRLAGEPGFEPVASFLGDGDARRRLQLAQRLADLLDQYQVYRSDWLHDWGHGQDRLGTGAAAWDDFTIPVPPDQRWQPALWRALLDALPADVKDAARPELHRRFLQAMQQASDSLQMAGLPRRVVLFGTTHIPHQTLEAIAALSAHCQVLMAVPNPCRFHWADIIEGRDLLRAARRRHAPRAGRDLAALPMQDMHAHGHPLLAAWGRQSRDFVRQLDAFDDVQAARQRFDVPRVDLFDEGDGPHLLGHVQAAIRELVPLREHSRTAVRAEDRSIVFHIAHGAHREVEILHDQLLRLFAQAPTQRPLNPRDVVVMVPDIDAFAPSIRAVFGQHARGHGRHIPWGIADQKNRGHQPILVALEWLLQAPQQRFGASEVRDLLDVPSVARRYGVTAEDLPTLVSWIEGAGVRWGLNIAHRQSLGLAASGDQNSWAFGLRRMLLGYATGSLDRSEGYAGVEPYPEIAGLSAGMAGALARLLRSLTLWWTESTTLRPPAHWAERLRALIEQLFEATDDTDRAVLGSLDDALASWLQACELAGFAGDVDLAVAREAWLGAVDDPTPGGRFRAGGVTFCTLLPMRAIPFEVVCLLGMNDGDYPRRSARSDFDLMALPGQARPGDRSRRDDDRQLMLDALLSARRVLYISWAGRSPRDNQEQPPSVLVSQLRDYLATVWGQQVLEQRTTAHPLQPFSRKYFEARSGVESPAALMTYASEWRNAHLEPVVGAEGSGGPDTCADVAGEEAPMTVTVRGLASFLRNPVKEFFRHRLQVSFDDQAESTLDDESFASDGLDRWVLLDEVLRESRRQLDAGRPGVADKQGTDVAGIVQSQVARLKRAGRLPVAGLGLLVEAELNQTLVPMVVRWQAALDQFAHARGKLPTQMPHPQTPTLVFDDWLVGLRSAEVDGENVWIDLQASKLADQKGKAPPTLREDKLVTAWVRCLASAACGHPAQGIVIGAGAAVRVRPPQAAQARTVLSALMGACHAGLSRNRPTPTALQTGLAFLENASKARLVYDGSDFNPMPGEGKEACLARLYPDFNTLSASPEFETATRLLYEPYRDWLSTHVDVEMWTNPATVEGAIA